MPPAAELMEELTEDILLRFPLHEPSCLVRAALVCKRWCRLVSGPGIRRRFREFHRTPPMLGFLHSSLPDGCYLNVTARFVPTTAFVPPLAEHRHCRALDARHGRVLLECCGRTFAEDLLVVWDPITDERRELPFPGEAFALAAAVVGRPCGHLDCHHGPFLVVFVGLTATHMFICTRSSSAATWSKEISIGDPPPRVYPFTPCALVGNALYFGSPNESRALKYDLERHEVSFIGLPPSFGQRAVVLGTTEDGHLSFTIIYQTKLYMWSRKDGPEADTVWTQDRVVELEVPLRSSAILTSPDLVGFVDATGVIFLRADDVIFTVDLKTCNVKQVCKGRGQYAIVPYLSFYTPDHFTNSDPGFHRRFLEFHRRAPPMLGFLVHSLHRNTVGGVFHTTSSTRFVPTPGGSSLPHANDDHHGLRPCDSRHGRVLLHRYPPGGHSSFPIIVWNPITGEQLKLCNLPGWYQYNWTAAVLCAATSTSTGSCDHLDCHCGPFVVVLVGTTWFNRYTSIYSSEAGVWSKPTIAPHDSAGAIASSMRSTLVGNTLYFVLQGYRNILDYNLCTRETSVIKLPRAGKNTSCERNGPVQLTTTEDGRLGLVRVEDYSRLCLWSRDEVEEPGWVVSKVIELHMLLPLDDRRRPTWHYLVGSMEGVGIIFLTLQGELFTVDLRSCRATKVYTHRRGSCFIKVVVPYVNFCTPGVCNLSC